MRESRYSSDSSEVQEHSSTAAAGSACTPEKGTYSRTEESQYETLINRPNGRTIDEKEFGARSKDHGEKRWKKKLRSMSKQINKVTSRRMHAKPSEDSKGEIKDAEKEDVLKKKKGKRKTRTKEEEEYTDFEEVDAPMKPAVVEILSKEKQVGVFPGEEAICVVKKPAEKKQGVDFRIDKVKQTAARESCVKKGSSFNNGLGAEADDNKDRSPHRRTSRSVYGFLNSTTQETSHFCTVRETSVANNPTLSLPRKENRKYYVDLPPYDNPTTQPVSNDRNHSEEVNKGADSTMNISKISQASESGRAETQPKSGSKTADTCRTALATSRDGFEFLVSSEFCNCEKYETGGKPKSPSSRRHHVHRNVEVLKMSKEGMEFLLSSEPLQLNSEQPALHASSKSPLPSKSLHSEMSTASDGAAQSAAENSEPKVHNVSDQGITPAESAPEEKTNPPRRKQKILQPKACAERNRAFVQQLNFDEEPVPKERSAQKLQSELAQPIKCTLQPTSGVS